MFFVSLRYIYFGECGPNALKIHSALDVGHAQTTQSKTEKKHNEWSKFNLKLTMLHPGDAMREAIGLALAIFTVCNSYAHLT